MISKAKRKEILDDMERFDGINFWIGIKNMLLIFLEVATLLILLAWLSG